MINCQTLKFNTKQIDKLGSCYVIMSKPLCSRNEIYDYIMFERIVAAIHILTNKSSKLILFDFRLVLIMLLIIFSEI